MPSDGLGSPSRVLFDTARLKKRVRGVVFSNRMPGHKRPPDVREDIIPTIAGISLLSPTFEKSFHLTCNDKYVVLYDFSDTGGNFEPNPTFQPQRANSSNKRASK